MICETCHRKTDLQHFHCRGCGKMLAQINGRDFRVEIICKRCRQLNVMQVPHPLAALFPGSKKVLVTESAKNIESESIEHRIEPMRKNGSSPECHRVPEAGREASWPPLELPAQPQPQ
jgi:phage FluMu protein Com